MTVTTALTTSWQRVATDPSIYATFRVDGVTHYGFGATEPTGNNYHTASGHFSITATTAADLWARLEDAEDEGFVAVDQASGSLAFGLLNVAPVITVAVGR